MPAGMHEKMSINPKTGEIHIPSVHRSQPGHPKGSFVYKDNKLTPRPGRHMQMNPGKENVWIQFTLASAFVRRPKKHLLSMRFQTNQAQDEPLKLVVKKGPKEVHTMEIPIPNTENKWVTTDPVEVGVELGGTVDTHLHFSHPKPVGKGILIRDFSLSLASQAGQSGEYSIEWLSNWLEDLQGKVKKSIIPKLDEGQKKAFKEACSAAFDAHLKEAKTTNEAAKKAVHKEFNAAMGCCMEKAIPMYEGCIDSALESVDFKSLQGKQLLQAIVLADGTPSELGEYAGQGQVQKDRLKKLLQGDSDLMYKMLVHGGPKGGDYGKALDIYYEIEAKRKKGKSVLPKLSLAVALELAEPLHAFQQKNVFIDPIERYLHYEEAYLKGELEPDFENYTIWELRMAINSDAPNEQLSWFREMIRTYNPNIASMDDRNWRYSWIVRTDVYYQVPEWTRSPHDYIQILSGGGMCGPRAWMGRFACKAFGVPTWGVRQPGHAAVTRWTPDGWITQLGGGFHVSWWEDRDGVDFECETKCRASLGDEGYFQKVALLDWIAKVVGEKQKDSHVSPNKVWPALAIVQRRRRSKMNVERKANGAGQCEIQSNITEYKAKPMPKESISTEGDGTVIVPMSCRASANGPKNYMKSFHGGQQVFTKPGFSCVFKLPASIAPEKKAYKISVGYANLHETDLAPFVVIAKDAGGDTQEVELLPSGDWQKSGQWQNTAPVELVLGGAKGTTLTFTRKDPKYPCSYKDLRLTPC